MLSDDGIINRGEIPICFRGCENYSWVPRVEKRLNAVEKHSQVLVDTFKFVLALVLVLLLFRHRLRTYCTHTDRLLQHYSRIPRKDFQGDSLSPFVCVNDEPTYVPEVGMKEVETFGTHFLESGE